MQRVGLLFILAGSLVLAPLTAAAQPAPKTTQIGMLFSVTPAVAAPNIELFKNGLRALGHVEGKTFVVVPRHGEARAERLPELARELVNLKVDVIVVSTDLAIAAVKRETQTIPIVMVVSTDPVGTGFVASLAHPAGNLTGLTNIAPELGGKRVELLREAAPTVSRLAFLWNPDVRGAMFDCKEMENAARLLRLALQYVEVTRARDLDRAFTAMTEQRAQAIIVQGPNPVLFSNPGDIVRFAQRNRLPSLYPAREYVDAGGLMSYGPSLLDLFRRAATHVDKILKGAKPGDLPVEQPTKFELVINLKSAKALVLTIPQTLLLRADQLIE
jgi:putative tryptophan/tyrosine transport system substrate-binding protein